MSKKRKRAIEESFDEEAASASQGKLEGLSSNKAKRAKVDNEPLIVSDSLGELLGPSLSSDGLLSGSLMQELLQGSDNNKQPDSYVSS